jgi:hypothetical protein
MAPLMNWTTEEPVPSDRAEHLPAAVKASEHSLMPVSQKAFAVAMDRLVAWAEQFGLVAMPTRADAREEMIRSLVDSYRTALDDLPQDLLMTAIDQTIRNHKFRNLPLPGDIRERVSTELSDRKTLSTKIKSADFFTRLRGQQASSAVHKPRSEADKQAVAEAAAKARALLANATIQRVPAGAGDNRSPSADPYRAAYAAIKRTGDE